MINKTLVGTLVLSAFVFSGCLKDDSERKAAEALDAKIDSAITAKRYEEAITLIDSLNKTYPLQIEIRRGTNAKRVQAMESWSQSRIPVLDKAIVTYKEFITNIEQNFKIVKPSSSLAGYYVLKSDNKVFAANACVQARVNIGEDAADTPWTLAVNAGKDIDLNKLVITLGDGQQYNINIKVSDGSMASIAPEHINDMGKYISENPQSAPATAIAEGSKGNSTISISISDLQGIAMAWQLASKKDNLRKALIERERLERQLQIARDQKANL